MRFPRMPDVRSLFKKKDRGSPYRPYQGPGVPPEVKENDALREENDKLRRRSRSRYVQGLQHGAAGTAVGLAVLAVVVVVNLPRRRF